MSGYIENVKSRIIFFLVVFALLITVLALIFSFYIIYSFQKLIVTRTAEFNLQLVASLIEQDIRELTALSWWCGYNARIIDYFLAQDQLVSRSMDAWNLLSEQLIINRAGRYVRRLLVSNSTMTRFLQVGNSLSSSYPVTIYNLDKILENSVREKPNWQTLEQDDFIFAPDKMHIPFTFPVYNPQDGGEIGIVLLGTNTGIITDKLRGYNLPDNSQLYLGIGGKNYLIEDNQIIPEELHFTIIKLIDNSDTATEAIVMEGLDSMKRSRTFVSYPIRDELVLIHAFDPAQFVLLSGAWPVLIAGLGVLIVLLAIMASGVNRMTMEITALMNKGIADEKNKRDLEYRMLQSQINPHFLYNTLNSIKWMATIQNAAGIAEMTTALSQFLKALSNDIRQIVPLRDELSILDDYMVIMKYRYGDSVNYEKKIADETLLDTPIPRFILQPLVENAIFHGIEPKGSGNIVFSVQRKDNDILIMLSDDGVGMSGNAVTGIGLQNIDERLRCTFGEGYGIFVSSEIEKGTVVTMRLPCNIGPVNDNRESK
ncbi:MAG: sensor histidine kinase [Treponema sp.]|jgi:two-component system sensor histidine kinase YesM|nr:sensor histidine kinase [Treponema sp.]